MQKDKIETLIGFAVKAGKLIYGLDAIENRGKKKYLIIFCSSCSERTQKRLLELGELWQIDLIKTIKPLEDTVYKTNCKVIAITDKQMSQAMLNNLNDNYRLIRSCGGNLIGSQQ